ncbi:MAG: GntR family transcriptional regulator [Bauldia sp.]
MTGGGTRIARGGGVSAWRQIADRIAADIGGGRFAPGAQLPVEAKLAEAFAVNRHTVRRALAALAADGLVRATQGRGTFVEAKPLPYRSAGGRASRSWSRRPGGKPAARCSAPSRLPAMRQPPRP